MSAGLGRRIVQLEPKETFFSQGDPADAVFYLQKGRAKVTVVSAVRQGSHHRALSRRAILSEKSRLPRRAWAASVLGHRHYRMHRAQD